MQERLQEVKTCEEALISELSTKQGNKENEKLVPSKDILLLLTWSTHSRCSEIELMDCEGSELHCRLRDL